MIRCLLWSWIVAAIAVGSGFGQQAVPTDEVPAVWRSADEPVQPDGQRDTAVEPAAATSPTVEPSQLYFASDGSAGLPNDAGQVWREYDISQYTARVTTTSRPEQAIVDWVLRETGYEAWHTEPLGILAAGPRKLRVYHTPEMQQLVADVVNRFLSVEAASQTFSLRVVTLDSPSWRAESQRLLRPVPVQTPGANAWLLAPEDAAILLGQLRRRGDYREHSSPYLVVNNGQSTLVALTRGRSYVRDVVLRPDVPTGFDPAVGQFDEGFRLEFSPLLSSDRRMIDATLRCEIDQIEKMWPVLIDVPTTASPRQRTKIEAPQVVHYRFHERFRWPVEQVLLVNLGMVALPIPVDGAATVAGLPLPIGNSPPRADLLVFVQCKGERPPSATATAPSSPASPAAKNYRGRY